MSNYSAESVAETIALATMLKKGGIHGGAVNAEQIAAKIQAGREVGLKPVQSINSIMIVNGKATIYGDACLALVRGSGTLAKIDEKIEGESDARVAVCVVVRKHPGIVGPVNDEPREFRFSVSDAKRAKLWGKSGPWSDYPERMLRWRALSWALRDVFSDVLCGLGIAEEANDIPVIAQPVEPIPVMPHPVTALASEGANLSLPPHPNQQVGLETLEKIAESRKGWVRSLNVDLADTQAINSAWKKYLREIYSVDSAKQLSEVDAQVLLKNLQKLSHDQEKKEIFVESGVVAEQPIN